MVAVISLAVMALAIYLLSIITDEFFIESLDQLSQLWKLPSNVAGASLMAMGSSAPELAIALLALFLGGGENSDMGIGTIVGSAVFNILVITGVSAIARPAKITWTVVVRDCVVYVVSILLLLVAFADGEITTLEALAFLSVYAVYIFVLFQWNKYMPEAVVAQERPVETVETALRQDSFYHKMSGRLAGLIRFLTGDPRRSYGRAFIVSIGFIAAISWVLVESAVVFAEAVHIPPVIVALTILAGGTSVPDMMSSVIVAKQGRGDMAIANAIGSNVFDILVGLGLPWLLAIFIQRQTIGVGTGDLWVSTLILLTTVVILFVFLSTGRRLSRREGWILVVVYVAYVLWTWLGGNIIA